MVNGGEKKIFLEEFNLIKQNKRYIILFGLILGISIAIAVSFIFLPIFIFSPQFLESMGILGIIMPTFLAYYSLSLGITVGVSYLNAAVYLKLTNQDKSPFRILMNRLNRILLLALIFLPVMFVVGDGRRTLTRIGVTSSWNIATCFVVPGIIIDNLGIREAFKNGFQLSKRLIGKIVKAEILGQTTYYFLYFSVIVAFIVGGFVGGLSIKSISNIFGFSLDQIVATNPHLIIPFSILGLLPAFILVALIISIPFTLYYGYFTFLYFKSKLYQL